jgi:lysine 6-dehydrogenase
VKNVLILGSGMVGSAMAIDLAQRTDLSVTVADSRPDALARLAARCKVKTVTADLSKPEVVREMAKGYDQVLGALSSVLGFQTLRAVIEAGRNYCDISFMPENALELDALAKEKGVTAVVDCGVAPGMSNMISGFAVAQLDPCDTLEIYVGGLPVIRKWPYEYKAGFAPFDVVEEYTRPSRIVENGKVVVREALTEPELMDLPGVGTVEAFNTDGLRSLIFTLKVPSMKEKTLRYPGHIELMRVFRHTGLFSLDPIMVNGQSIRPRDLTSALLFPKWTFEEGEADLTVMRVTATGKKNGKQTKLTWDLLDYYDPVTKIRSMSRTTAFPATIVAGMLLSGEFKRPGVNPPELLGKEPGILDKTLAGLAERGVKYSVKTEG